MKCHSYIFFTTRPSFFELSVEKKDAYKKEFINTLKHEKKVITHTYATLGLKVDTTMLIWFQAETIDEIQLFLNSLTHTKLGEYLEITYTLFGMTRPTQYSDKSTLHLHTERKGGKYFV